MQEKTRIIIKTTYFSVGLFLSVYLSLYRLNFWAFFASSIYTFLFFIGIYFCFKGILKNRWRIKTLKIISILILIALIGSTWIISSFSGFHSSYCYNLVGKSFFTSSPHVYCNYPPWYTKIIGGDEARKILLEDCLNRKSPFYENNPNYCDAYKNNNPAEDWAIGPNP